MIIERLKSKLPGSPIPPVQVSTSASILESKAVGFQGRKEREVTAARKSSLQIDAVQCFLK